MSDTRYLIRNTAIVSFWRGGAVVAGFLLDAYVVATFGLGHETDAFFVALAIPALIDGTIGVQVTQALPPILASVRADTGFDSAVRFLNALTALWVVTACLGAALVTAVAGVIVTLQAPGLMGETLEAARNMSMLLAWLIPLSGLVAVLQGALFWRHRFGFTSAAKAINSTCVVAVVAIANRTLDVYSLALGYLIGYSTQAIVLTIVLRRSEVAFGWVWEPRTQQMTSAVKLIAYPLAGQLLAECRTLIENYLVSFYSAGVLSALRYATRLVFAISGLVMTGVVTAATPMVAYYVAANDMDAMKRTVRNGFQLLLFLSIPIAVWLVLSGSSIVSLMFERGQFTRSEALMTGTFLALLAPYVFFSRAISLAQTPFYAVKDTRSLTSSIVLSFIAYAVLLPVLRQLFGVYGLPLAMTLSTGCGVLIMAGLMRRSFGALGWSRITSVGFRLALAGAGMGAVLIVADRVMVTRDRPGLLEQIVAVAMPALLGLLVFVVLAVVFRVVNPIATWRNHVRHGFTKVDFGV
jgi:putative peptidoglycan lipid II flippase